RYFFYRLRLALSRSISSPRTARMRRSPSPIPVPAAAAGHSAPESVSIGTRSWVLRLAVTAAALAAVACLWSAWCEFPHYAWNDMRLAPAFAVAHGINPYPDLGGGPLSTWIYGP